MNLKVKIYVYDLLGETFKSKTDVTNIEEIISAQNNVEIVSFVN